MGTLVRVPSKIDKSYVPSNSNAIHVAVKRNQYTSVAKALKELSPKRVIELLCQTDTLEGSNPLHYAAKEGNIFTVKLLVNAYLRAATDVGHQGTPPWLTKNSIGNMPARSCIVKKTIKSSHESVVKKTIKSSHESIARYLVSRDHDFLRKMGEQRYSNLCSPENSSTVVLDKTSAGILFCAMREGFSLLAEQIIVSGLPYSLSGTYGDNPLRYASKCNEKVCRLLLEKHPELIDIGKELGLIGTILERAVEDNATWLVKLMLIEEKNSIRYSPRPWTKACRRLIWHTNSTSPGDTPLHIAARKGNVDIVELLLQGYESATQDEAEEWDVAQDYPASNDNLGVIPLHIKNLQGDIPLFVALKNKHDDLGVYLFSAETHFNMSQWMDGKGQNAYEIAVENGCEQSRKMMIERTVRPRAEELLITAPNAKNMHPSVLKIVQHIASTYPAMSEYSISEDHARLFLEALPRFERDPAKDAISHLDIAAKKGEYWLVKLLLEGDKSLINHSTTAWKTACDKGGLSTLLAFVEQCDNQAFVSLCRKDRETPLHHIKLPKYEQYKELLSNPVMQELMNDLDESGATPLHLAIERNDLELSKALFETDGIKLDIENLNHKTALDLLEEKCIDNDHFFGLYKGLLENPLVTQDLKNQVDRNGATPLHRAIKKNDRRIVSTLMEIKGVKLEEKDKNGETSLCLIEERCKRKSEENRFWYNLYKKVVLSPDMILKMKNHSGSDGGATPLHIPIEWDDLDLTRILVQAKGIKLNIKSSNSNAETALDLVEERCFEKNSQWYDFYKELLAYPDYMDELKNRKRGVDEDTPLHRAIKREDINLTKTLLVTKGVELDIKDRKGKTALDLLEERYNLEKWGAMCREIRLDPSIKIFKFRYFQRRTSLVQMQETLSVVAALLATITFAAGIAVPGGMDQTDGTAILGKSAAFLVFTIANTLAMCSSIVVLFTVIGAMIWEAHPKATSLIDLCPRNFTVFLLQLSLGGTSVAFMTGVYAIMSPKIKWAAYVVIGLSSLAFILALTVVSFFWPLLYKPFSYFWQAVCVLVSHLKRWFCCGDLATDNSSPDAPSQQSGNLNTQQVMGRVPDSSTVISLPSNEAESFANANTMLINGASDGPTPAALPSNEPPSSANTIMPVMPTAGPEHSQQELQKTNQEAGESSESKATGSECKIDIGEGEPELLFASNK